MHEMEKSYIQDSILKNDRLSHDYGVKLAEIFSKTVIQHIYPLLILSM